MSYDGRPDMTTGRLLLMLALAAAPGCASTSASEMQMGQPAAMTSSALELRQGMRELWSDHVVWTRAYIVAAVADDPSASTALSRLMKNQEDLGAAMAPYYGQEAGTRLTQLLKDHISIAGEVVTAAKTNNQAALGDADRRWHSNAVDIANFLS